MRRVIAPIAAVLLVLAVAGPVAADPTVQQSKWPNVYKVTCADGTVVPDQYAHGIPGWDANWLPGDTPWLLMGYSVAVDNVVVYVSPLHAAGLVGNGKLFGPCTVTTDGADYVITDAWFLKR